MQFNPSANIVERDLIHSRDPVDVGFTCQCSPILLTPDRHHLPVNIIQTANVLRMQIQNYNTRISLRDLVGESSDALYLLSLRPLLQVEHAIAERREETAVCRP